MAGTGTRVVDRLLSCSVQGQAEPLGMIEVPKALITAGDNMLCAQPSCVRCCLQVF